MVGSKGRLNLWLAWRVDRARRKPGRSVDPRSCPSQTLSSPGRGWRLARRSKYYGQREAKVKVRTGIVTLIMVISVGGERSSDLTTTSGEATWQNHGEAVPGWLLQRWSDVLFEAVAPPQLTFVESGGQQHKGYNFSMSSIPRSPASLCPATTSSVDREKARERSMDARNTAGVQMVLRVELRSLAFVGSFRGSRTERRYRPSSGSRSPRRLVPLIEEVVVVESESESRQEVVEEL